MARCGTNNVECVLIGDVVTFPAHVLTNSTLPLIVMETTTNRFVTIPRKFIVSLAQADSGGPYSEEFIRHDLAGFNRNVAVQANLDHMNLLAGWKRLSATIPSEKYKPPSVGVLVGGSEVGACPSIEVQNGFISHRAYTVGGYCGRVIVVSKEDCTNFALGMHVCSDGGRNYACNLSYAYPMLLRKMELKVELNPAANVYKPPGGANPPKASSGVGKSNATTPSTRNEAVKRKVDQTLRVPIVVEGSDGVVVKGLSEEPVNIKGVDFHPISLNDYMALPKELRDDPCWTVLPEASMQKFRGAPSGTSGPGHGGADSQGHGV